MKHTEKTHKKNKKNPKNTEKNNKKECNGPVAVRSLQPTQPYVGNTDGIRFTYEIISMYNIP